MPVLPAVVTIADLPMGTTPSGSEPIETIQSNGFTTISVQLTLNQIAAALPSVLATVPGLSVLGNAVISSAVPTAITGTAGQFLQVNAGGTGLLFAAAPPADLGTTAGLSVLGVAGVASAVPVAITGAAGQFLGVNAGGTALAFIDLPAAAVTSVFGRTGAVLASTGDYSFAQISDFVAGTQIATTSIGTAQIATAIIDAIGVVTNIGQTIVTATVHTAATTEREIFVSTAAAVTVHVIAATTWFAADTNGLPLVVADVGGNAASHNITVSFVSDTCDGLSSLTIANNFGFVRLRPVQTGNWILL